jgi:5,10-methylenetetrahydromethanopterin reductase
MQKLPNLSVRLHGELTPQQCVEQAQAAEAAGFGGVWFAENPFNRSSLPTAGACATATRTLRIGAGVFNPYSRHPTLIAMEVGTLDELSGGRVRVGIGSGIGYAIERMGFAYDRPLATLRETMIILRALFRGEEVNHRGAAFTVQKVKLDYPARPDIPIFMAGRGYRSLLACGEMADGLIISNMCTVTFIAKAVKILHEAARNSGRSKLLNVAQYIPCIPRADRREAQRLAMKAVAKMLPVYWMLGQRLPAAKEAMLEGSGISEEEFAAAVARLNAGEEAEVALDERFVLAFTVSGNVEDCRRKVADCTAAGVTELALTFCGSSAAVDMRFMANAMTLAEG